MKSFATAVIVMAAGLFFGGCDHLDLKGTSLADRVAEGTVAVNPGPVTLPAGSEVVVRVLDMSRGEGRGEALGEQTITDPGATPVKFRIEYRAEDEVLRRRVTIDARVSIGGKIRYYTASAHPITAGNVRDQQMVEVVPVDGGRR